MYLHTTNKIELAKYLGFLDRIYYRFMAERINGEFQVTRLIVGPRAPWKEYEYSDVIFIAGAEHGQKVGDWLLSGKITTWYNKSFPIMALREQVDSNRHPSHSQAGLHILAKPFTMYRVPFVDAVPGQDHEYTSIGAPFFLSRWEAERHLLYDIAEDATNSLAQMPEPAVYVYIEHPDAWLEKIHFSLTALELHLDGKLLIGAKLKVVGSGIQDYDDYPTEKIVTIPLPNGRPDYLKIALIKDGTWLDYYIDNKNYRSNPLNPSRSNVTFAEPETKDKIVELIDRGEGKTIEFKADISLSSQKLKWLKTIAAFANGEGGSLILGISDEEGSVTGINGMLQKYQNSISKLRDAITLAISDNIDPVPDYDFLDAHIDNHDILVINVHTHMTKCFAIYQNQDVPTYYIRRGATTRVAGNSEVQELIRLKSSYSSIVSSPFFDFIENP